MAHFDDKEVFVESPSERFERYQSAVDRRRLWEPKLQDAYSYALPEKNNFWRRTPGEEKNLRIWDATALTGLQTFASNIQSMLMPPFRRWAKLKAGRNIPEEDIESVNRQLEGIMDFFFDKLDDSNFALAANESLQEMGISLGTLLFNEGTDKDPFEFTSVALPTSAIEVGKDGHIDNFWRSLEIPVRDIKKYWPRASLTPDLLSQIRRDPTSPVKVIEGTITYQFNPPGKRIYYYVQMEDTKKDILTEFRDFNPWIGFRWSSASREGYGTGPILSSLPFIRNVNQLTEYKVVATKFQAYPIYTAASTGLINPYTLVLEPGSIIPIEPNFITNPPIQPLPQSGNPILMRDDIIDLQRSISEILFADPLGPVGGPDQTATEITARQQNWIRRSGASFGRLTVEFVKPVIEKGLTILWNRGLISPITTSKGEFPIVVDGNFVDIEYKSPLIDIQNKVDLQAFDSWVAQLEGLYGKFGLIPTNGEVIPGWLADKNNVDLDLLRPAAEYQAQLQGFTKDLAAQISGQQQVAPAQAQLPSAQQGIPVQPVAGGQAPTVAQVAPTPNVTPISG